METKELIEEVYKGAQMGVESIDIIKNYVEDRPMLNILNNQKREYQALVDEIEQESASENLNLQETKPMDKAKLWGGVILNTIKDRSTGKIAEIMMQGTNMGIISLTKATNRTDETTPHANRLMNIYKNSLETYKIYL